MNVNKQKITNNLIWKTYIEDINWENQTLKER
jgi:hypothetical protein